MTTQVTPIEFASSISPYQPGAPIATIARDFGLDPSEIVKLASNENPLGMSPLARIEVARASEDPARYPDPDCYSLRGAIGDRIGISADQVLVGAGLSEVIVLLARAFLGPKRSAVFSQYSFTLYDNAARSVGAKSIIVPAENYAHDTDAMIAAVDESVSLMYVATPNNPTGTVISDQDLLKLLEKTPSHVLVVLDEAYREFLPPAEQPDSIDWLKRFPNLIVMRTFSKIYGLAGLRVGYAAAAPSIINVLQRFRSPFSVSSLAQSAAEASLSDFDFVKRSYELNAKGLAATSAALDRAGIRYVPSRANFLLIEVGDGMAVFRELLKRGIIARPMGAWGLPSCIRVTIGTTEENQKFVTAITDGVRARAA